MFNDTAVFLHDACFNVNRHPWPTALSFRDQPDELNRVHIPFGRQGKQVGANNDFLHYGRRRVK